MWPTSTLMPASVNFKLNMDFIHHLKAEFNQRRERNSLYSLRAFARDLGVSDSMLSKIMKGKKALSLNLLERFVSQLKIEGQTRKTFLGAHPSYYEKTTIQDRPGRALLIQDVILELLSLNKELSLEEICIKTSLSRQEVEKELSELLKHKLINKEKEVFSCLYLNTDNSSGEFTSLQLRDYQKVLRSISINSVDKIDHSKRLHCSMTLSVAEENLEELKDEILKFQKKINELTLNNKETENKNVYTFLCSLFPLIDSMKEDEK